jgi:hypothetical protein
MSNKFLGQYLLEKGVITPQQLLLALELQKQSNPSLGQLAIAEGYLNDAGATKINLEQQRTDERFGTLAIQMGLMTESQVNALFQTQQSTRKFFGEILVEQGIIDHSTLEIQLKEHQLLKEQVTISLSSQVTEHKHAQLIHNTLETIVKSFTRIPKIPAMISEVLADVPVIDEQCYAISQLVHNPLAIKIGVIMPSSLMKDGGTNFLGFDVSNDEALYVDATSELLNIILGNVLVINGAQQSELDPPKIQRHTDNIQSPYKKSLCVNMSASDHVFTVFFMHD